MRIRKAKFPKKALALISLYREKEPSELRKIEVRWACGKNYRKATYRYRYVSGHRVFYVNLKRLISSADFGEMGHAELQPHKLFNGVDERDYRVVQSLDHWSRGGFIDPPEICVGHLQKLTFGDGRHRTIAAFHLGQKEIPVVIHVSALKEVSGLINLKKVGALSK